MDRKLAKFSWRRLGAAFALGLLVEALLLVLLVLLSTPFHRDWPTWPVTSCNCLVRTSRGCWPRLTTPASKSKSDTFCSFR